MTQMVRYDGGNGELDTMQLGQVLAKSGYFSDARDAAQAIVKVLAGREMGIGPIAAMTGIYIVKGRVTLSANLMAAQIKRSGRYTYSVAQMTNEACEIVFFEIVNDKSNEIGRSAFTKADATQAGLWNSSDPWKKTPRNMLFARAMSNGAKWFCPDVFSGPVYTPDELTKTTEVDPATGEILDHAAYTPQAEPTALPEPQPESAPAPAPANGKRPATRNGLIKRIEDLEGMIVNYGLEHKRESFDAYTDEQLIEMGKKLKAAFDKAEADAIEAEAPGVVGERALPL